VASYANSSTLAASAAAASSAAFSGVGRATAIVGSVALAAAAAAPPRPLSDISKVNPGKRGQPPARSRSPIASVCDPVSPIWTRRCSSAAAFFPALLSTFVVISSKMLGGASQIVSMIRVKCNGKYKNTHLPRLDRALQQLRVLNVHPASVVEREVRKGAVKVAHVRAVAHARSERRVDAALQEVVPPVPLEPPCDIVKDVRGSESNCEHDSRTM